jgi:hypothetical protein
MKNPCLQDKKSRMSQGLHTQGLLLSSIQRFPRIRSALEKYGRDKNIAFATHPTSAVWSMAILTRDAFQILPLQWAGSTSTQSRLR